MIAASEPVEFVPHGRTVLASHPGQIYGKHNTSVSENSLLYKLTNFAIKDESLLIDKEEDNEWWCVREVYYRQTTEVEDDPISQKDPKYDYNSESFRPSSRLKNDFNLSLKSELLKKDGESAGPSRSGSANSSSNMSKKFNLNSGGGDGGKDKPLNPDTDCCYEEELYVRGRTAVWSKGLVSTPGSKLTTPETRETIACYTIENPIKHAAFANFHVDIKNTMLIDALNSQIGDVKKNIKIEDTTEHIKTEIMPSIVLLDSKCMRVYAVDGREYITSIPFQVKKVWPMKYGILLEKDATPAMQLIKSTSFLRHNESQNSTFSRSRTNNFFNSSGKLRTDSMSVYDQDVPLPTCFSLTHPLDEVTPILMKSPSQGLQYYNDGDLQIIFVSTTPSIILVYDWKLGIHSLWRIRKATRDECLSMCPNMNTTTFSQSCDYIGSPMQSNRNTTSWVTGLGSPHHSKKGLNTPIRSKVNNSIANLLHQQGLSPHTSIGQASSTSMMANTVMQSPPTLPLYPDICIDHIWTDNITIKRDPITNENDIKTFLHTDLVGHEYLCFIVKVNAVSKLQILRLQKSHYHGQSNKTNVMVGTVSTVLAKDAVAVPHLNMFALVDEAGNIILQSGNSVVGKVHIGGVLARLIDSPYTKRSNFQSPFPKRSSLLPSRGDTTFDDSALHLLSPVPHTSRSEPKETLGVCFVRDGCGRRVTVQVVGGALRRVTLPPRAAAALPAAAARALQAALPADHAMQVIIKWYGVRNSPGTQDLTPLQEWTMFSNLLLALIGYDTDQTKHNEDVQETASKKQRTSNDGSHDDWEFLLNSKLHKSIGNPLATMLKLPQCNFESKHKHIMEEDEKVNQFNSQALLFPHVMQVLFAFHLLYEEIKLNTLLSSDLKPLATFLFQLAKDLKLHSYMNHYWLDFPSDFNIDDTESVIKEEWLKKVLEPSYFTKEPPNIFSYLNSMFRDVNVGFYPYLVGVNETSKDLIEILCIVGRGRCAGVARVSARAPLTASTPRATRDSGQGGAPPHCQAVLAMCDRGMTPRDIDNLPPAVSLAVLGVLARSKAVSWGWGRRACALLMREELAAHHHVTAATRNTDECLEALALETLEKETAYSMKNPTMEEPQYKNDDAEAYTGMEHLNTKLLSLLYPKDHRMTEVISMLQSSQPVVLNLTQRPEVSDHDFIEEQEKYLYGLSTRTMALPIGRGMVTLRTCGAWSGGGGVVPRVCVWGRGGAGAVAAPPDLQAAAAVWPTFHSAAAAGLALVPNELATLDAAWLHNNKPKTLQGGSELSPELAGFLLALGLNGHLKDMPFMNIYEYLVKCNEMVSIGLLLGLAATYRGTMDVQATKLLSIHVEALLPATSVELDIHQNILVAALLAVGLLYHDTHHNHYAQVLLNEIGKPSGCENEQCVEREGYALSAGLALGMVMVGAGAAAPAHLPAALRHLIHGGDTTPTGGSGRVNVEVCSPGATLALGLVFLRTRHRAAAAWLAPPATTYHLDFVRPDLLMLRVIARSLILWDEIEPSEEWIESQVPDTIKPYCFVKPTEDNIDYEAMNQAYCNMVGGACFALGVRYAGSGLEEARDAALGVARRLLALGARSLADLAGRATLEACTAQALLAAAMIMAGRGDLATLRLCRRVRARMPAPHAPPHAHPLSHGGQMAVSCCIGLLFLLGGRGTLGTSRMAVCALLAAFFPKFPTHSEDNRYHLQAFRHLYVLAVEPRLILPRDLDTGKLCYAHIQVVDLEGAVSEMKAPCMIPELATLREVRINDPRYWPVTFHRDRNWEHLQTFLQNTWCVDIKQRAGCLSYCDDPHGFLTLLAQTLTVDHAHVWTPTPDNIHLFTNDDKIKNLVRHYLNKETVAEVCADCLVIGKKKRLKSEGINTRCTCRRSSLDELELVQGLSMVTYECLVKDMLCALPSWTAFLKIIRTMKTDPSSYHTWQIKLLLSQIESQNKQNQTEMSVDDEVTEPLISTEFTIAIKQKICHIFDNFELKISPYLRKYLGLPSSRKLNNCDDQLKKSLASYIVYHDLQRNVLKDGSDDELSVLLNNEDLTPDAVSKIGTLVR